MVKDTNKRENVTLTREQSKELEEMSKEYKMSKSALIGFAVTALLSYKAGDLLGNWIVQAIEDKVNNDK